MITFRNYLVNLLQFMPEHLRKDPETNALLKAESAEHILQEETLQDIFRQFFVSTATLGLALWENVLGIVPKATDDYTQRRNKIYLKLQRNQTSTKEFMAKLAARYFPKTRLLSRKKTIQTICFGLSTTAGGCSTRRISTKQSTHIFLRIWASA